MKPVFLGAVKQTSFNRPIYGMFGKFTLSESVALPYFSTALPIARAIDELRIAEEVHPSLDNRWSLNELFQREIDRDRVRKDLVRGYLSDPKKLKFFNAMTVVLMPRSEDGRLLDAFQPAIEPTPAIPWSAGDEEDAAWGAHPERTDAVFGGVQLVRIGDSARLRWSTDLVHAVVVDGQHRLVALRDYRDQVKNKVLSPHELDTKLPIIFVLLHPAAGFVASPQVNLGSIRAISRELFTDLNKNAKTVDKARELVLDDWSIVARCVRRLITDEAAKDDPALLPLTLVRWQEAINRFDTSYYLNSLTNLDQVVETVLELDLPKDPLDRAQVERFIDSVNESLAPNRKLQAGGRTLEEFYVREYVGEDGNPQTPMARLPSVFLESAVEGFDELHRPWLLRVLCDFAPYADLLAYARQHSLIEGTFGRYYAQSKQHREGIKSDMNANDIGWHKREILDHSTAIEALKGRESMAEWAYKTIFQKALVRLARVVAYERRDDPLLGNIDDFLSVFNALHRKGVLRVEAQLPNQDFGLWALVATNAGSGKIKVTRTVEDRILALLRLWYYANRKLLVEKDDTCSSASRLVRHFRATANSARWHDAAGAVEDLSKAFDSKILFRTREDQAIDRKRCDQLIRERLAAVLRAGILIDLGASSDADDGVTEGGGESDNPTV